MMDDVFTSHYLHDVQVMRFDYLSSQYVGNLANTSTSQNKKHTGDKNTLNTLSEQDHINLAQTFRLPIGVYSLLNV